MTARRVVVATPWRAPGEVGDVHDALERIGDPPVDEEVDIDRCVVPGDGGLAGDFDELLARVDLDRAIDDRDQEVDARAADHGFIGLAEAEDHHPLVLLHHANGQVDDHEDEDEGDPADGQQDCELHRYLRSAPRGPSRAITCLSMMTRPARP